MDEFLEHMLSMPSWSDAGGVNKSNWVYNGNPGNGLNTDPISASKIFSASTMASSLQDGNLENHSDLVLQSKENQDNAEDQASGHLQFPLGDLLSAPYLNQRDIKASVLPISASLGSSGGLASQRAVVPHTDLLSLNMMREEAPSGHSAQVRSNPSNSQISNAVAGGSINGADLAGCRSVASSGSEGSAGQQATADRQSSPPITAAWRQPYIGGVSPVPLRLGQAKSESFLSREEATSSGADILGRYRDEDRGFTGDHTSNSSIQDGSQGRLFLGYGTAQGGQRTGQPSIQPVNAISSQGQQSTPSYQGLAVHAYGSQPPTSQPQPTNNLVGGAARPRVRARRGQATDPHSIAERLRRERIAERMKALQELVPNANKTDKASMLDEIIEYVKFLQLQVKVLSMSRLGSAGAIAPLVADVPSEELAHITSPLVGHTNGTSHDGIALTERQVARLMEEDMGSAMQYLQSKGLCLMPISLATAMSSTATKTVGTKTTMPGVGSGDKPSVAVVPISNSLTTVSIIPASATGGSDGCKTPNGVGGSLYDANENNSAK